MLADIKPTSHDFRKLSRYLIHGKARPNHPDRVAWITEQNIGSSDPELAAAFMQATAAQSRRCAHACYHLVIAWHAREQPTPENMQAVARATLKRAGLAEHQALIMGHGDKPHPHLHMMINRVSPVTGRAWSTSNDYARFDRIMRELAEETAFTPAPAHRFNPELTEDLPRNPNRRATYAGRRGAQTTRPQWSTRDARAFGKHMNEKLDGTCTWSDLSELLDDEGLQLEAKGRGHVIGDAGSYVKLSALGLQISAKTHAKERRRSPRAASAPPVRSRPLIDAVDIARSLASLGLADMDDVRAAVLSASNLRLARLSRAPLIDQLLADLRLILAAWTALTPPKRRAARQKPQRPNRRARSEASRQR
jgi:hypothetical protein